MGGERDKHLSNVIMASGNDLKDDSEKTPSTREENPLLSLTLSVCVWKNVKKTKKRISPNKILLLALFTCFVLLTQCFVINIFLILIYEPALEDDTSFVCVQD